LDQAGEGCGGEVGAKSHDRASGVAAPDCGRPEGRYPMTAANQSAIDYLKSLAEQGFWGFLTLKFEHGGVVHFAEKKT
jgi:hypothetical protein